MHQTLLPGKKSAPKPFLTLLFVILTFFILTHSGQSLYFALNGLNLWFSRMLPALLPFMILSGMMIRLGLTEGFASLLHPLLHPIFRVRKNVSYAMIMGFLCGFPMGARVTGDLLKRRMITQREASLLLSFCNNIGPVYFLSFALPLLKRRLLLPYLFGMYGIPLLYGLFLRHTLYRDIGDSAAVFCLSAAGQSSEAAVSPSFPAQLDDAIQSSLQSILMLGGYMILFNLLNLLPFCLTEELLKLTLLQGKLRLFLKKLPLLLSPVLEITGGLGLLKDSAPILSLALLSFGGLSCIAQTASTIKGTSLSIAAYIRHRLVLTGLTLLYYLCWYLFAPAAFLL